MNEVLKAFHSPLAQRLGLYVILASTFVSIFTSSFQIFSEYKRDVNAVTEEIREFENTQLFSITSNVWVLDIYELGVTLKNIISLPYIEHIVVYEDNGTLVEVGTKFSEKYISKEFPLIFNQSGKTYNIGKVIIRASLDGVNNNIYERIWIIIVSNMVKTFIVALLILFIFYHLVARHLIKISQYTEQLDLDKLGGIFDYDRAPNTSRKFDELDVLRSSFIRMQQDLSKSSISLKNREKEQSEILNSMIDAVISIDEDGNILSFNRAAEFLFGYGSHQVIGNNVGLIIPDRIARKHDEYLKNYTAGDVSKVIGLGREVIGMTKDGNTIPLRLFVAKLPLGSNGKKRYIGTCVDLTYIKSQEEQLRRSQKMDALGKLTGGIAHDFNNLLSIIIGYSDLLKTMLSSQPNLLKYVKEISHAGDRGVKLTKRLLSFSREHTHNASKLDINLILSGQKDMLNKIIAVKTDLKIQLEEELWPVWLDDSDFEDAIINLCINAIHAMQGKLEGACLSLSTKNLSLDTKTAKLLNLKQGDYIKVMVSDNGKGMDEQTRDKIFDPFFTTKGTDGTGLGLTQVFGFVKRSNGVVEVNSALNKGTEFNLYFPRFLEQIIEKDDSESQLPVVLGGNETILVVEDEVSLRELTKEMLTQKGYKVICVGNGVQALNVINDEEIDLVLTDVIMPEMDGFQLASEIQKKHPQIKVQVVSGYSDKRHLKLKNNDFHKNMLRKPFNHQLLLNRIRELLDNKNPVDATIQHEFIVFENKQIQPIKWDASFSVGDKSIDKDHQDFISLINQCIEVVNGIKDISKIGEILEELSITTPQHFALEETELSINNSPLLQKHIKVHQIYIDCLKRFTLDYSKNQLSAETLLYFLTDWLKEHILGMDKLSESYFVRQDSQPPESNE